MLESRRRCWSGRNVGGAERVARECARWRVRVDGVGKYWAAGAERAHGHEQAMLECDVPSNSTRWPLLREMQSPWARGVAVARDAGTRRPYQGRSSSVR
jgi:hypothetical protein